MKGISLHRPEKALRSLLLACILLILAGCQAVPPQPVVLPSQATPTPLKVTSTTAPTAAVTPSKAAESPSAQPEIVDDTKSEPAYPPVQLVEPAGCLSLAEQEKLASVDEMLAYADSLLQLSLPLSSRRLHTAWNGAAQEWSFGDEAPAFELDVSGIKDLNRLQEILNSLHVAGFVSWLRVGSGSEPVMNILAIPLVDQAVMHSSWGPYIEAYWRSRSTLPDGDDTVLAALKLPPCGWMVEKGFAPAELPDWWSEQAAARPDYATAARPYLAADTDAAYKSAEKVDWLGPDGAEGPHSMCGPLVWAIQAQAGAFPPGFGGWSVGAKAFWLSKPRENGRPWSLFPSGSYHLYEFHEPMGAFDFEAWPLYPGDFVYSYSKGDGFDHMFLVTEIDADGNVYTVTNLIQEAPTWQITVERVVLYNVNDPTVGIIRNAWNADRVNGRTGHAGFDVFRWAWVEKDISGKAVEVAVQPGDSFYLLAERWKTPAEEIARYNHKSVEEPLRVGDMVLIPPVPFW